MVENGYRAALISTRMCTRGAVPIARSEMQNGDKARGVFVNSPFNRACTKACARVRECIFSRCRRYLKINEPLGTRTEGRTLNTPYACRIPGIIVETRQGRGIPGSHRPARKSRFIDGLRPALPRSRI